MDYYLLLEKLLHEMHDIEEPDMKKIGAVLMDFCALMHIARIDAEFYESKMHEVHQKGETFCMHNNGKKTGSFISKRVVSEITGISVYTVYREADANAWTETECSRIELVLKTVIFFISRSRVKKIFEKLTYYDDDGYANLRYYIRYVDRAAQGNTLDTMAAIHFNLKHFSLVNQQIGRKAGSFVMRSYYRGLEELVGNRGTVCRVGGDNFVVICSKEMLDDVIEYLNGTSVIYDVNSDERIKVYTSIGVFIIPENFVYNNSGDIMDKIMFASLAARKSTDENIVYYNSNMVADKEKIMWIQQMFPDALKNEEFHVFYQPKIDIHDGSLVGAEALCRWFHDGEIVSPADFIPTLEQGTEICKLDFYMLDHVCKDIRRWLDEGRDVVRVSVNLSRKHMVDADLLEHIIEIVDRNNVPHKYVEIELTETTTDVEFRDLKRVVRGLQDVGICTSVDDFGMGYSSLNLIKEIPWDVLKVDRSFLPVDEDTEKSTRSVMFKYVVAMAKEMGLECIAEGVETKAQIDILKDNRCNLAQGFFFDKPLPINDFENRMDIHKYDIPEN